MREACVIKAGTQGKRKDLQKNLEEGNTGLDVSANLDKKVQMLIERPQLKEFQV